MASQYGRRRTRTDNETGHTTVYAVLVVAFVGIAAFLIMAFPDATAPITLFATAVVTVIVTLISRDDGPPTTTPRSRRTSNASSRAIAALARECRRRHRIASSHKLDGSVHAAHPPRRGGSPCRKDARVAHDQPPIRDCTAARTRATGPTGLRPHLTGPPSPPPSRVDAPAAALSKSAIETSALTHVPTRRRQPHPRLNQAEQHPGDQRDDRRFDDHTRARGGTRCMVCSCWRPKCSTIAESSARPESGPSSSTARDLMVAPRRPSALSSLSSVRHRTRCRSATPSREKSGSGR